MPSQSPLTNKDVQAERRVRNFTPQRDRQCLRLCARLTWPHDPSRRASDCIRRKQRRSSRSFRLLPTIATPSQPRALESSQALLGTRELSAGADHHWPPNMPTKAPGKARVATTVASQTNCATLKASGLSSLNFCTGPTNCRSLSRWTDLSKFCVGTQGAGVGAPASSDQSVIEAAWGHKLGRWSAMDEDGPSGRHANKHTYADERLRAKAQTSCTRSLASSFHAFHASEPLPPQTNKQCQLDARAAVYGARSPCLRPERACCRHGTDLWGSLSGLHDFEILLVTHPLLHGEAQRAAAGPCPAMSGTGGPAFGSPARS